MSEESTEKRYTFTLDKEITMSALVEDLLKQYAKGELEYGN